VIDAGSGNDTITAGFGPAVFDFDAFGHGSDVINGSRGVALNDHQQIDVSGLADTTMSEMIRNHHLFQSGANVVITDGAGSVLAPTDMTLATLRNSDFIFALPPI